MRKWHFNIQAINIITTIIVVFLPMLKIEEFSQITADTTLLTIIHDYRLFLTIGLILMNILSIYLLFSIFKVILLYAKVKIQPQILYFLLMIAKCFVTVVTVILPIHIQLNHYFILGKEFSFSLLFCLFLYLNGQHHDDGLKKAVPCIIGVTVLFSLFSFIV